MDSFIQKLMDILADNNYTAKYKDIPEDVDNRDEIIAEIQAILDDDGLLPDSLRYFELNGETSALELTTSLKKTFLQFKNEFLAAKHEANESFKHELLQQLDVTEKELEQEIHASRPLNDKTLIEMLETKVSVCGELKRFVQSHHVKSEHKNQKKEQQKRRSFKWLKDDDLLTRFYDTLKINECISQDTEIDDFKAIFKNIPVSGIKKPVQWEKGAKLFAYFFHKLITKNYIPKTPSWIILQYCFTYNKVDIGKYVQIEEGVKAHVTVFQRESPPKGSELIDELFQIGGN